jgi:hypothetical protein
MKYSRPHIQSGKTVFRTGFAGTLKVCVQKFFIAYGKRNKWIHTVIIRSAIFAIVATIRFSLIREGLQSGAVASPGST